MHKSKKNFLFVIPVMLILFFWKDLILHISSNLYNLLDPPFLIWTIQNNIRHFSNIDFERIFDTNAMYPFPFSLSFSDHLYVPSLLSLVLSIFSRSPIVQFNLLVIVNHLLVLLSLYLLVGRFTKNPWIKTIISIYGLFSPYFFSQLGHFQMLVFWPILLAFYFIFQENHDYRHIILASFFLGVQMLSSVYLGFMGVFLISAFYLYKSITTIIESTKTKTDILKKLALLLKDIFIMIWVFGVVSSVSLYGYFRTQQMYKPSYEQGQYVYYSAHFTDYLFPSLQESVLYTILRPMNSFDKHVNGEKASWIGFLPATLIIIYFGIYLKSKQKRKEYLFVFWPMMVLIIGIFFSVGPRLNWNGKYLITPLPYLVLLKLFPFLGLMRAVARWYFIVFFSTLLLLCISLTGLDKTVSVSVKKWFYPLLVILMCIEFYPSPVKTFKIDYWSKGYEAVKKMCSANPGPMLEYPFEYRAQDKTTSQDLMYKTHILFVSMYHDCEILSGFSGYQPKKFLLYQDFFQKRNFDRNSMKLLIDLGFKYIKFNLTSMNEKEKKHILWFVTTEYTDILYQDSQTIFVKIKPLKPLLKISK